MVVTGLVQTGNFDITLYVLYGYHNCWYSIIINNNSNNMNTLKKTHIFFYSPLGKWFLTGEIRQ